MIEFKKDLDVHNCTSYIEGNWIIWKCPYCLDYERRLNLISGKMRVRGKTEFRHQGVNEGSTNITKPITKNICDN